MFLKWLFTSLAFLWIYHAVVRPLFMGFYYGKNEPESHSRSNAQKQPPTPPRAPSARQRYQDDEGDYVDYEEVKK